MKIACCGSKSPVKPRETKSPDGVYHYEQCGERTDGKNFKMLVIGAVCLAVLIIIILGLATALSVVQSKPCDPGKEMKEHVLLPCEDGWIFYLGICYLFSETEGNWTDSQRFCASHNASLAIIATQKEMDFVMRFKGIDDHWIGLSREPKGEWKWPNGTAFNNWFNITGDSNCAYLNHDGARNARCYADRKWICTIGDVLGHHRKSLSTGGANHDPRKNK